MGILNQHDKLLQNIEDWTKARDLAEKRLPAYQRLQCLARHADGLDAAKKVQPQIDALAANRSLLDTTDPVPDLTKALADVLRAALAEAEKHYAEVFDEESTRLESAESWQAIEQSDHDRILKGLNIGKADERDHGNGAGSTRVARAHFVGRLADPHCRAAAVLCGGSHPGRQVGRAEDPSRQARTAPRCARLRRSRPG